MKTPPAEETQSVTARLIGAGSRPGDEAIPLVYAYLNRAVALVADGYADRDAIDAAMRLGCGLPEGPLRALDNIGLDTVHATLSALHARTGEPRFRPAPLLTALARDDALGGKSGQGLYGYGTAGDPPEDSVQEPGAHQQGQIAVVGVVGSGTMARGVAEAVATSGFATVLTARSRQKADLAVEAVAASLSKSVLRGRRTPQEQAFALSRLSSSAGLDALRDCDLVIEAVIEDPEVKHAVFERLGAVCQPGAVLATSTSSLSVTDCAKASGRPADVIGLHFFNPAPVMRLVELVRTDFTAGDAANKAAEFCQQLGKVTVPCGDRPGFIVNYLLFPYLADAIRLLDRHPAGAAEVDKAVEQGFGHPMGPFALLDTIGLDVCLMILRRLHEAFPGQDYQPPARLAGMVDRGYMGRKTGRGFLPAAARGR